MTGPHLEKNSGVLPSAHVRLVQVPVASHCMQSASFRNVSQRRTIHPMEVFSPSLGRIFTSLAEHQKGSWLKFRNHVLRQDIYILIEIFPLRVLIRPLRRGLWELSPAEGTLIIPPLSHSLQNICSRTGMIGRVAFGI